MNPDDFRKGVIRPVLQKMDMWLQEAEDLMLGTALVESKLKHLFQKNGPALSFYQIEIATAEDIYWRYLVGGEHDGQDYYDKFCEATPELFLEDDMEYRLVTDMSFATAIARLKYWMVPEKIPNTISGQAEYWKLHYNTPLGKGTVREYIASYQWGRE